MFLAADADQPGCLNKVTAALDLIQSVAPTQLARMRRLFGGILVFPVDSDALAVWRQDLDACLLKTSWMLSEDTTPEAVASCIIHELMHARLDAAGFLYNGSTRARVERICALAERNFVRRLPLSDARTDLEEAIADHLAIEPSFWTDEAVQARARNARRSWPLWQRALFGLAQALRRIWLVRGGNLTRS